MADLKQNIKEAKNSIKEKDFQTALVYCKAALKINKTSYQALVLFGKVCQELEKLEESKKALLLATEVEPSQPVAWLGLGALQEKHPKIFEPEQSLAILSELCKTADNEKKENIYRRKCSLLVEMEKHTEAVETMKELIASLESTRSIKDAWSTIVGILSALTDLDTNQNELLIEALRNVVNETSVLGENERNYQMYIKLLYKNEKLEELVTAARNMNLVFPTAYPLQWLARVYSEAKTSIPIKEDVIALLPDIEKTLDTLLEIYPESPWGNVAKGINLMNAGEHVSASTSFRTATTRSPNFLLYWKLLLDTLEALVNLPAIESTCRKIDEILNSSDNIILSSCVPDSKKFHTGIIRTWAKVLYQMGHENHLKLALSVLNKIEGESQDISLLRLKILVKLNDLEAASKELAELQARTNTVEVRVLEAVISQEKGFLDESMILYEGILKDDPRNADALYGMGRLYYSTDKEKSLVYLLKAAKFDQEHCGVFSCLGRYYKEHGKLSTARKCFEQVLRINPCSDEAGAALSDVYRDLELHDENLSLLLNVTSEEGVKSGGWAWLRLGLHYLATDDCEKAVKSLQGAVQICSNDSVYYECLGDAYLARGSHNAALRAFTKAQSLSTNGPPNYARSQIAYIQRLIGEYLESIQEYESVLSENPLKPIRIVCLVGLVEVLLARARQYLEQQLLSNVKDDCLKAIEHLSSVIPEYSQNTTVWKLLSEACTIQASFPASLSEFEVPGYLIGKKESPTVVIDKVALLELGCRSLEVAMKYSSSSSSLWHDLGVNLYYVALCKKESSSNSSEDYKSLLERAVTCIKKSLVIDSVDPEAWDSLGVVAFFLGDNKLSQHAFLKSLNIRPTAETWCHLATLYLMNSKFELAEQAYKLGQAVDPSYINCWVGMAMVAERDVNKSKEEKEKTAFKLFRHTTVLGYQTEARLSFANCVMRVACNPNEYRSSVNVDQLIPTALDSLAYYTRGVEDDPVVLNMLGLAYNFMGLKNSALRTFEEAEKLCSGDDDDAKKLHDVICGNKARSLSILNRDADALEAYSSLTENNFTTQCGIALANLKEQRFQEAYQNYVVALNWPDISDDNKAYILVALAFLHYKCNVIEEVKTLLFQSSLSANGSVEGFAALAALGHLLDDSSLTTAALAEMEAHSNNPTHAHKAAFLKAAHEMKKKNYHGAKMILSKALRSFPQLAELWRTLSFVLLSAPENSFNSDNQSTATAAINTSRAARNLSQQSGQTKDLVLDIVMETLAWVKRTVSITPKTRKKNIRDEDMDLIKKKCIAQAQKAVILCPDRIETWSVLIAALGKGNSLAMKFAKHWIPKSSSPITEWLKLFV